MITIVNPNLKGENLNPNAKGKNTKPITNAMWNKRKSLKPYV